MKRSTKKGASKRKRAAVSDAARIFMELVGAAEFEQGPDARDRPLTNFTFWAGPGFSKSWDPAAPIGRELFRLGSRSLDSFADPTVLSRLFGIDGSHAELEDVRQIVYQLDMYEKYPDVRSRYVDAQNISMMRGALRAAIAGRYDEIAPVNYFDDETSKFPVRDPTQAQRSMLDFFGYLHRRSDGSQFFAEGLRFHFATTNYDYVIETILDNIIGADDSLFLYWYRGFTPSRTAGIANPITTHQHWLTSHLLKLNGGFEILRSGEGYDLSYQKRSGPEIARQPPVLMLPSREQDYSDPYFREIFPKAVRLMRETNVLIIAGYSMPDDDALMRFIIRQFAEEPEDGRDKLIFVIDPSTSIAKMDKLKAIFSSISQMQVPHIVTYEGGFAEFAGECVSLIPPGHY